MNLVISIASGIIVNVFMFVFKRIVSKDKSIPLKRMLPSAVITFLLVAAFVWVALSLFTLARDASPDRSTPKTVESVSSTAIDSPITGTSAGAPSPNTVLEFAGASQTQTHNAGSGHNTRATVLVKKMEFDEEYTLVTLEVENSGDSDLAVNTAELHGSTSLVVNGKSYAYVKHTGDAIAPGTTGAITYYFECCAYRDGDSLALNFHLGLPLQYNIKDLQEKLK